MKSRSKAASLTFFPQSSLLCSLISPGPVYTPLQPASRDAEGMKDWAVGPGTLPLHGRPLQPSELGASYVYLADNGASNGMTGQVIHLNVGQWFGS